jgi:hypothetical protein
MIPATDCAAPVAPDRRRQVAVGGPSAGRDTSTEPFQRLAIDAPVAALEDACFGAEIAKADLPVDGPVVHSVDAGA